MPPPPPGNPPRSPQEIWNRYTRPEHEQLFVTGKKIDVYDPFENLHVRGATILEERGDNVVIGYEQGGGFIAPKRTVALLTTRLPYDEGQPVRVSAQEAPSEGGDTWSPSIIREKSMLMFSPIIQARVEGQPIVQDIYDPSKPNIVIPALNTATVIDRSADDPDIFRVRYQHGYEEEVHRDHLHSIALHTTASEPQIAFRGEPQHEPDGDNNGRNRNQNERREAQQGEGENNAERQYEVGSIVPFPDVLNRGIQREAKIIGRTGSTVTVQVPVQNIGQSTAYYVLSEDELHSISEASLDPGNVDGYVDEERMIDIQSGTRFLGFEDFSRKKTSTFFSRIFNRQVGGSDVVSEGRGVCEYVVESYISARSPIIIARTDPTLPRSEWKKITVSRTEFDAMRCRQLTPLTEVQKESISDPNREMVPVLNGIRLTLMNRHYPEARKEHSVISSILKENIDARTFTDASLFEGFRDEDSYRIARERAIRSLSAERSFIEKDPVITLLKGQIDDSAHKNLDKVFKDVLNKKANHLSTVEKIQLLSHVVTASFSELMPSANSADYESRTRIEAVLANWRPGVEERIGKLKTKLEEEIKRRSEQPTPPDAPPANPDPVPEPDPGTPPEDPVDTGEGDDDEDPVDVEDGVDSDEEDDEDEEDTTGGTTVNVNVGNNSTAPETDTSSDPASGESSSSSTRITINTSGESE